MKAPLSHAADCRGESQILSLVLPFDSCLYFRWDFKSLNCIKHMQIDGWLLKCRCPCTANPRWKDRGRGSWSSGSVILLVALKPNTAACTLMATVLIWPIFQMPRSDLPLSILGKWWTFNEWSLVGCFRSLRTYTQGRLWDRTEQSDRLLWHQGNQRETKVTPAPTSDP